MKKKNRSYRRGFISIINETRIMQESQCSSSLLTDMNQQEGREDFVEEMVDGGEHDKLIGSDDEKSVVESSILHIYKHADLVEKIIPEFDILKEIVRYEENLKLEKYIEDGNVLLHPNLSTTKIQFSRGLNEYFEKTQTFEKK